MWRDVLTELLERHRGKVLGAIAGFLLGILLMWAGFFWTLLLLALAYLGYQLGRRVDEESGDGESLAEFFTRLLRGKP